MTPICSPYVGVGHLPPAPPKDCWEGATNTALLLGAAGVPVGFFRAHVTLKDLTLAEKMQRWKNVKLTARIMASPMGSFAATGFAFAAADCAMQNYMGREDPLTGIVGGLAAGAVQGLRTNSAYNALKYGAVFAAGMVVADFLTKTVPSLMMDLKSTGPVELDTKPHLAKSG
eukprot:gene12927-13055_t